MTKKILITGAGGFIGVNLARRLLEKHKVIGLDNERRNSLQYYPEVSEHENFSYTKGDILDEKLVRELVRDADVVLHLAAMAGVSSYYKEPFRTLEVNIIGTNNILKAIEESKVQQLLNFASSEVYGTHAVNAKETDNTVQGPVGEFRWVYAVSKTAAEHLCLAFAAKNRKVMVSSTRPFNVYGPGQTGEGAIRNFVSNALKNKDLGITGDGKQIRAWCYVNDAVRLVELILQNPQKAANNTFNMGNPEARCTIKELAETIIRLANSKSGIKNVEHIGVDIMERYPNIDKAREILGFKPAYSLESGLKETIEWYRKTGI